jgi:hypothetical protein
VKELRTNEKYEKNYVIHTENNIKIQLYFVIGKTAYTKHYTMKTWEVDMKITHS